MAITAQMVQELRAQTGAGIMECKEALKETDGNMEEAVDFLRKKGAAKAAKKADRSTKEGAIASVVDGNVAAMVEVKCETDFVARNETFKGFTADMAATVLKEGEAEGDALLETAFVKGGTVKEALAAVIHEIGENIQPGRAACRRLAGPGVFGAYIHGGGAIGVLVELACGDDATAAKPELADVARDIAMHVAATNPLALNPDNLDPAVVAREKDIYVAKAKESGKPDNIVEKIVEGQVKKFFAEVCLTQQTFVKDPDKTIAQLLEATGKTLGDTVSVTSFVRFQLGE
jgi:elongation factor Ts